MLAPSRILFKIDGFIAQLELLSDILHESRFHCVPMCLTTIGDSRSDRFQSYFPPLDLNHPLTDSVMKHLLTLFVLTLCVFATIFHHVDELHADPPKPPEGFRALFNGQDLS
ncbi:MAG: hypothetical protein ACK578_11235 [Pirellula sp.]